jgi:uncharacterized surface protein with fasciclin (FAS1) repeats
MPGDSARRNGLKGGRPKGAKSRGTLTKEMAREYLRELVIAELEPLVQAQLAHARGIGHLYVRDKTGKFTKIENQARADELLATGKAEQDYWIFTKDPSIQAFADLLNRALDKPTEAVVMTHEGAVSLRWLTDTEK